MSTTAGIPETNCRKTSGILGKFGWKPGKKLRTSILWNCQATNTETFVTIAGKPRNLLIVFRTRAWKERERAGKLHPFQTSLQSREMAYLKLKSPLTAWGSERTLSGLVLKKMESSWVLIFFVDYLQATIQLHIKLFLSSITAYIGFIPHIFLWVETQPSWVLLSIGEHLPIHFTDSWETGKSLHWDITF